MTIALHDNTIFCVRWHVAHVVLLAGWGGGLISLHRTSVFRTL